MAALIEEAVKAAKEEVRSVAEAEILVLKKTNKATTAALMEEVKAAKAEIRSAAEAEILVLRNKIAQLEVEVQVLSKKNKSAEDGVVGCKPSSTSSGEKGDLLTDGGEAPYQERETWAKVSGRKTRNGPSGQAPNAPRTMPVDTAKQAQQVKQKTKKRPIIGSMPATLSTSSTLKAVQTSFPVTVMVSRVAVGTTPIEIENHVNDVAHISVKAVYRAPKRYAGLYSTFLLTARNSDLPTLLDPSMWPSNIFVKRYYLPKKRLSQPQDKVAGEQLTEGAGDTSVAGERDSSDTTSCTAVEDCLELGSSDGD